MLHNPELSSDSKWTQTEADSVDVRNLEDVLDAWLSDFCIRAFPRPAIISNVTRLTPNAKASAPTLPLRL